MKTGIICGSFDLLHQGHINLIKRARRRCDVLLVGVNSDKYIQSHKGHNPVLPENVRRDIVAELRDVTNAYVIENGIAFVQQLLNSGVNITEYYRGDDARGTTAQNIENKFLCDHNIKPVYFKYTQNISSTKIRNNIKRGA